MVRWVYVVVGNSGRYDENRSWVVCACDDEATANGYAAKALRYAKRIARAQGLWRVYRLHKYESESTFFDRFGDPKPGANPYDPDMASTLEGIGYYVSNVPIFDAVPTRAELKHYATAD